MLRRNPLRWMVVCTLAGLGVLTPVHSQEKPTREPDVIYVPTPHEVVDKMLDMADVRPGEVVYDLGCGDGRIPVAAASKYGIEARGFDIDPKCVAEARANVQKNGVERLVTIEDRDIFTLDLSRGPTVVTLYLLPSLNEKLLPQLQRLPAGARVLSVEHRMADIPPDQQVTVDTEYGEYTLYLWRVETLRRATAASTDSPSTSSIRCGGPFRRR